MENALYRDSLLSKSEENILSKDVEDPKSQQEIDKEEKFYEEIIGKSIHTRNRIFVFICAFFVYLAYGKEMTIFNLIIKPVGNYFDLEESGLKIQIITSSVFLGVAIGSMVSSFITLKIGRIYTINLANIISTIANVVMSIYLNYIVFTICRFFVGFAFGNIIPLLINILAEYCPIKFRGFLLMLCCSFYAVGALVSCLIGYKVMPNLEEEKLQEFLFILISLPSLSLISCLLLLKDGPKFLFISNYKKTMNEENINESKNEILEEIKKLENTKNTITTKQIFNEMFNPELKKTTILLLIIFVSIGYNAFGIYSISSYFLDYLDEKENGKKTDDIKPENEERDIYINQMMNAVSYFGMVILGGILGDVKKIGRKGGIIIFNIIATVSTVLGIFKKILFEFTSPISFGSTSTFISLVMDYVVELYPTKIRDNSSGILFSVFKISCFIYNYVCMGFYNVYEYIPYFIYIFFSIVVCILIILLPYEMAGKHMN